MVKIELQCKRVLIFVLSHFAEAFCRLCFSYEMKCILFCFFGGIFRTLHIFLKYIFELILGFH